MKMVPTPSQTVGPFFSFGLTEGKGCVSCMAGPQAKGDRVLLVCRVLEGDGLPVPDAIIEIWQADADGIYNHPDDPQYASADPACRGFGRVGTSEGGICEFETIKPGRVQGPDGILQAPHLNLAVFARGLLNQVYTRAYFANDPANREDPVLALIPEERRETLIAQADDGRECGWKFEIRLQGENETVFFDV